MYSHRWYVKLLLAPNVPDCDTNYIQAIKHRLVFITPPAKKYYGFNINDIHTKKEVKFSPNKYYHVIFNFNPKFLRITNYNAVYHFARFI